jgi:hypothetical protein
VRSRGEARGRLPEDFRTYLGVDGEHYFPDHFRIASWISEMAYFSIAAELAATIYIRAANFAQADAKLKKLVQRPLDAHDPQWFSDEYLGNDNLPEISLASAMTLQGPAIGADCEKICYEEILRQMRSDGRGRKSIVLRNPGYFFAENQVQVFQTDIRMMTTGFIKCISLEKAHTFVANLDLPAVHWEQATQWFSLSGFNDDEFPLILSPNMTIIGEIPAYALEPAWPGGGDRACEKGVAHAAQMSTASSYEDFEIVCSRVKAHLVSLRGNFATMSELDVRAFTRLLFDRRDKLFCFEGTV